MVRVSWCKFFHGFAVEQVSRRIVVKLAHDPLQSIECAAQFGQRRANLG